MFGLGVPQSEGFGQIRKCVRELLTIEIAILENGNDVYRKWLIMQVRLVI